MILVAVYQSLRYTTSNSMNRFGSIIVGIILFAALAVILIYNPFSRSRVSYTYITAESIPLGAQNRWNSRKTMSPTVLYDYTTKTYQMWYVGVGDNNASGIGYATSSDGLRWSAQVDQVITPSTPWEARGFRSVHVVRESGRYYAWYSAQGEDGKEHIGHATSSDGLHWAKSASNPIMTTGDSGAWDSATVGQPYVLRVNGEWRMWYTGTAANAMSAIGHAVSSDGVHWQRDERNPVLTGRATWNAAGVSGASVTLLGNGQVFQMWFSGVPQGKKQMNSLGRAYSVDGVTWAEDETNPLVVADNTSFADPLVVTSEGVSFIWAEVDVTKPLARHTIHFTQWPQEIENGKATLPSTVPVLVESAGY